MNGQPIAEKDQTAAWTGYIYANGQKIAKVDSSVQTVHLHTPSGLDRCSK